MTATDCTAPGEGVGGIESKQRSLNLIVSLSAVQMFDMLVYFASQYQDNEGE